jgi:hypothetical protein
VDPENREDEQKRNTDSRRIKRAQQKADVRQQERQANTIGRGALRVGNLLSNIKEFEVRKKEGPTSVCACCGGLWFQSSTRLMIPTCSDLDDKVFFVKNSLCPDYVEHVTMITGKGVCQGWHYPVGSTSLKFRLFLVI